MKRAFLVLGILVLALGIGCLNYTTESGAAHHREWAQQHGFPEPSYSLFVLGALLSSVGAGTAGFAMGRSRKS
jgi:hypothetical protein